MSTRQVTVTYSGSTGLDIDEDQIADDLDNRGEFSTLGRGKQPSDDQIAAAIERDIAYALDNHGNATLTSSRDVVPTYHYDRPALIASVRAELARRQARMEEP